MMKVLITGANGFIGKNLMLCLQEQADFDTLPYGRENSQAELVGMLGKADAVIHLAGVNRPQNTEEYQETNAGFTQTLIELAEKSGRNMPILFASSSQAELDNPYGKSKLAAEECLRDYKGRTESPICIFRLPNVFGKWCRPEYNSVVATFCHHIANGLPIEMHDETTALTLVYIDDLLRAFLSVLESPASAREYVDVAPQYSTTLGGLAEQLYCFRESRNNLVSENVGTGLVRALYSTYLSYLPPDAFSYDLNAHCDERGAFVEFLKTKDSGQFSFFTAKPGILRGGHYHHSKTEKFLVVHGQARFRFRHMDTGQEFAIEANAGHPRVIETIPGWAHDIANTGDNELVVMLWANEIFDQDNPDTIGASLDD